MYLKNIEVFIKKAALKTFFKFTEKKTYTRVSFFAGLHENSNGIARQENYIDVSQIPSLSQCIHKQSWLIIFREKGQAKTNRRKFCGNYGFPKNFTTRKLCKILIFWIITDLLET